MTRHEREEGAVPGTGELPRSIEPRRDLWPDIERRIREERVVRGGFSRWRRELIAVAAMLALFVAAVATGLVRVGGEAPRVADVSDVPSDFDRMELEHASVSRELLDRLDRGDLDPATVEVIRQNLQVIDGAVEEIRSALDQDPENPRLSHQLKTEYRRRGAVLRQAADLAESI